MCEQTLIQGSAADLLRDELGRETVYAYNTEQLGETGTLGRKSYKEILLTRYFREALLRLNPWLTPAQLDEAQRLMEHRLSTASLLQINEEKYFLIRDGIPVTVKKPGGRTEKKYAAVIDFQNPDNNRFLAVQELKVDGDLYHKRPDIVGFVNGIPLLFVELKAAGVDVQDAYTNNYTDYLDTIPHLFYYNAFLILSNGLESKVGTLGSKYEFFHEWKRLKEEEQGTVALETMLRGICKKENFLDLLENFILFDHSDGHTAKILARNHQYLGVNEAVDAYASRQLCNGKLGVFWHTQGSGKSYSMVFLAQKIRRKFSGSPTIVVLTDRVELNKQISDTFENCGVLGAAKAGQFIASDGADLLDKLRGNPSFVFTLIQKFNRADLEPIYPDHDILIMSDEAHRSQYGVYADNMVRLLPTASRIGFTGTPLLSSDHITERTFGGYISVYDFQRAVDDGAMVPLYYENRGEKILDVKDNPEITDRILDAIEQADLDVNQQDRLERERKLQWMQETEMAVVISQEQNEVQTFRKWGLDIQTHREKMEKRELDKDFKDAGHPLRVVFVCAMWLTGFDVKCLSCLYLDKPLKAHTLMQTIARANRVAEGKSNGLIIDYIGIVKALRKALADYTANASGAGSADPTVDKEKLIARILEIIASAESFLAGRDFALQALIAAKGFEKLDLLKTAANAVSATLEEKKTFQTCASELARLVKYANREDVETDVRQKYEAIAAIHRLLNQKRQTADNVDLMVEINRIISEYVQLEQAAEGITPSRQFDISKIDFDLLRREFSRAKKKNLILKDLQDLVCERLDRMLLNNPSRIQYHERYQAIIEDYNSQQDRANIEKTFDELMKLVQSMDQEEQRYVREGFSSDEELSLYDMLFSEHLSKAEIQKLKKVAVELLQKVKARIAELDHWTDKQETKADIDNLIRDTLWNGLPECYDELRISSCRQKIYEYVYTRYKDVA